MNRFVIVLLIAGALVTPAHGEAVTAETLETEAFAEEALPDLSGRTITLDVEELDVRAVLKLLAQSRRLNIVAGPEVQGTISVNLFEVPFEDALDAILGIGGYTHYKKGEIIFVTTESNRGELSLSAGDLGIRVYEISHSSVEEFSSTVSEFLSPSGKQIIQEGKLVVQDAIEYLDRLDMLVAALDVPPEHGTVFEISHAEPQEVLDAVNQLLSPRGVAALSNGNRIIVRDIPDYVSSIAELLEKLDTAPRQVLISARMLNVSYDDDLSLGTEFVSSPIVDPKGASSDPFLSLMDNFRGDVTALTTGQAGIFSLIIRDHEYGFIEALSKRSRIETLSAPQLLTLDGEMAKIQVGERLGFRITTTTQTSSLESVEFLEVGTVLEVTPTITADGLVRMDLNPKVSTGSISSDGLPEEKTTEASTSMLVRNGETILIGGLINASRQRTRSGVPVLSKIPLLGLLFGQRTHADSKSEMIILVTPHLVTTEASGDMLGSIEQVRGIEDSLMGGTTDPEKLFERISPFREETKAELTLSVSESPETR